MQLPSLASAPAVAPGASAPARPQLTARPVTGLDAIEVSTGARANSQLQSLAEMDPEAFKAATTTIAERLMEIAGQTQGFPSERLQQIAERFAEASRTGDFSSLSPSGPPPRVQAPAEAPAPPTSPSPAEREMDPGTRASANAARAYQQRSQDVVRGQVDEVVASTLAAMAG